jgi:acyl carrier protein
MDEQLMRCFSSVFPDATDSEIQNAAIEALPGWDSLRAVTLLAVLDEQFNAQIELPYLLELRTFDALKTYLVERSGGSGGLLRGQL